MREAKGKMMLRMKMTASGKVFDLHRPHPDDIDSLDIAHGLSQICRYNGRTPIFYSVAQHSLLVASLAAHADEPPTVTLAALLHDAAEAYTGDIIRPLKGLLHPTFHAHELAIETAIREKFSISEKDWRRGMKYDLPACRVECMAFWPEELAKREWTAVRNCPVTPAMRSRAEMIRCSGSGDPPSHRQCFLQSLSNVLEAVLQVESLKGAY